MLCDPYYRPEQDHQVDPFLQEHIHTQNDEQISILQYDPTFRSEPDVSSDINEVDSDQYMNSNLDYVSDTASEGTSEQDIGGTQWMESEQMIMDS